MLAARLLHFALLSTFFSRDVQSFFAQTAKLRTCLALPSSTTAGNAGNALLTEELVRAASDAERLSVGALFASFASNAEFRTALWQQRPYLCSQSMGNLVGAFTMAEVQQAVDSDFIEAGRGTPIPGGGWNMATVSEPRGSSFEDAKLRFQDVEVAMKKSAGTVVFNSAGGFIPPLAGVCLETIEAFDLPAALNMYLTNPGQQVSAPPHTDRQDVFVLQTQGQKRWRVFSPPAPGVRAQADPFARGKGKDELSLAELSAPLIDTVLSPGQVLYVPAGFPHTTDTIQGIQDTSSPSVHLTVGLDTHVWGLSYAGLRSLALRRQGKAHNLALAKTDKAAYWRLQQALPLGFLATRVSSSAVAVSASASADSSTTSVATNEIISGLIQRMREVEPQRWTDLSDDAIAIAIGADEAVARMVAHHRSVTDLLGRMYADVALKLTPAKFDLSFFRSQPYFQQLEATQAALEAWADNKSGGSGSSSSSSGGVGRGGGFGSTQTKSKVKGEGARVEREQAGLESKKEKKGFA